MNEELKVSILLLSYNNFCYIFEALNSIFFQTYENIELIISDDCSEDFDRKKIEKFISRNAKQNIKKVIINQNLKNEGTVAHIEKLRAMSSGDLITSLAADDAYAAPESIEKLVDEYKKNSGKIRVVTSLAAMCDTKLKKRMHIFTSEKDMALINSGDTKRLFEELSYRCIISASGTLVERSLYLQIGDFKDYRFVEDWTMHLRLSRMGIRISCINEVTYLHRDGGVSHGNTRANKEFFLAYYNDLLTMYTKEIEPYEHIMSEYAAKRARFYYESRVKRHNMDKVSFANFGLPRIVFYVRKNVAAQGDFSLYYRIASCLAEKQEYDVYCVNNSNSQLQKNYLDSKIQFCDITKENVHLFEGATFVVAFNQLMCLMEEIAPLKNAKIVPLFLHPYTIDWWKIQFVDKLYNFNGIAKLLKKNQAYGFQDEANVFALERHTKIKLDQKYFPLVVDKKNRADNQENIPKIENGKINVAWLGRLDSDKIFSLVNFLDNLYESVGDKKVDIHIVGDGNGKNSIKFNKYSEKFRFIFTSFLYGDERNSYLKENADFVLAMGVSALDVASLRIPTILPLVSTSPFAENKYVYFHEAVNYSLGWQVNDIERSECRKVVLKEIITDIYEKDKKQEISKQIYDYVERMFFVENKIEDILDIIKHTTLTAEKIKRDPTIKIQLFFIYLFKKFVNPNGNYIDFLAFHERYVRFSKLPFITKIKKIIKKAVVIIRRKVLKRSPI